MAYESGAESSSTAVKELQENLINLSRDLEEVYNILGGNVSQLNDEWKDNKYDEFVQEFGPHKEEIYNLSQKYQEWAHQYLQPRIDALEKIEKRAVSIDGGSGGGYSGSGDTAGGSSAGVPKRGMDRLTSGSKADAFRQGIKKVEELDRKKSTPPGGTGGFGQNERERGYTPGSLDIFLKNKGYSR